MRSFLLGIAGGSGSGKTTLAGSLANAFAGRAALLRQDDYYKARHAVPFPDREKTNYDEPGAFDTPLLLRHLRTLAAGGEIDCPVYDYAAHDRTPATVRISPAPLIIAEGILLFHEPEIRAAFDLKVFVDASHDVRLARRIERDTKSRGRTEDSVRLQFETTVEPMHALYVEPGRSHADLVIPMNGPNPAAFEVLKAYLAGILDNHFQT